MADEQLPPPDRGPLTDRRDLSAPRERPDQADRSANADPLVRTRAIATAMILGALFALSVTLIPLVLIHRDPLPPISPEQFREARRLWQRVGPFDYDVVVEVTGRQSATYRVEVRDGRVHRAFRDGQTLKQGRTLGTWSVPGMFGTIAADVANVERVMEGTSDRSTPQLQLRGVFDPELGYPRRYYRVQMVKMGENPEVSWRVVSFRVPEPRRAATDSDPHP